MEIVSKIILSGELNTISELSIDGVFYGYVLEDPLRAVKIKKITGIPKGKYDVVLTWSGKYSAKYGNIKIPEIIVPDYVGVRFHPGNYESDTAGCIMIGKSYVKKPGGKGWILQTTKDLSTKINYRIIDELHKGNTVTFEKI